MSDRLPVIIQGGMGIAVSNWELAKTVSIQGQLGVVSGTAIDNVMARRLQDGDKSGITRRALAAFPNQDIVKKILDKYFIEGGKAADAPYVMVPKITLEQKRDAQEILIVANFVEVWLAKEGHNGLVGINFLHKIQMTTAASVFGAMLIFPHLNGRGRVHHHRNDVLYFDLFFLLTSNKFVFLARHKYVYAPYYNCYEFIFKISLISSGISICFKGGTFAPPVLPTGI